MEAVPKIMLLSHASPVNITKHWAATLPLFADQKRVDCWPCHKLHDTIETCRKAENAEAAACIADISHEEVFVAAKAALRGESHGWHSGIPGKGNVGFFPEQRGGDAPDDLECGSVARCPVVGVGV
jgi:hypothetical protein